MVLLGLAHFAPFKTQRSIPSETLVLRLPWGNGPRFGRGLKAAQDNYVCRRSSSHSSNMSAFEKQPSRGFGTAESFELIER